MHFDCLIDIQTQNDLSVIYYATCAGWYIVPMKFIQILFAEPEGYHFGTANGLGLVVWRNAAAADDDDDDDDEDNDVHSDYISDADMDKIAFGFMTWQPNATLLHYASKGTGDKLDIKLVSFFYRAMHFSAKRGIAIIYCLSVRPSVSLSVCPSVTFRTVIT